MSETGRHQADKHRARINFDSAAQGYDEISVLQKEISERLLERLDLIRIDPRMILDLGSGTGAAARRLERKYRKSNVVQADFAIQMLRRSAASGRRLFSRQAYVCADAELLPFRNGAVDMAFSNLMMQWSNDLDRLIKEVCRVMAPAGLFIFSSFGPDTLKELRECWSGIDDETHVNVFMDMHDVGDALVRAGFVNPVMEAETVTMTYGGVMQLFRDLKSLGAGNVTGGRRRTLTGKARLKRVIDAYENFRTENRIPATYEVVYGHAWSREAGLHGGQALENGTYTVPVSTLKKSKK